MATETQGRMATGGAPVFDALVGRAYLEQQVRELQVAMATMQREFQQQLDEVWALAASASLDSTTTKRQVGMDRESAWLEGRGR